MPRIRRLAEAQNHRCCYCSSSMVLSYDGAVMPRDLATLDHVKPRTYGGTTAFNNAVAACYQCNNLRGEMEAIAFYNLMQKWFRRDPTLQVRWHQLDREELFELRLQCVRAHERQLHGLGIRCVETAFLHMRYFTEHSHHLGRA